MDSDNIFEGWAQADIDHLRQSAVRFAFVKGQRVFSEGDSADFFYIIEQGRFVIFIDKLGQRQDVNVIGAGDFFGEMAILNQQNKRVASIEALDDGVLLGIDKYMFIDLVRSRRSLADRINKKLLKRNEEFILKEMLLDSTGLDSHHLHVSIKGDPSLRESAFSRERYQSQVDIILPQLQPRLIDLLLQHSAYKFFIAFNSGEMRIGSVFDPFHEEIHTAEKMIDPAYLDRHFPSLAYAEKTRLVQGIYHFINNHAYFSKLPEYSQNIYRRNLAGWQPVSMEDITRVIGKLSELRSIQNFYLRNISISMVRNSIRMQFNCDGTHIVSTDDYQRFLDENIS